MKEESKSATLGATRASGPPFDRVEFGVDGVEQTQRRALGRNEAADLRQVDQQRQLLEIHRLPAAVRTRQNLQRGRIRLQLRPHSPKSGNVEIVGDEVVGDELLEGMASVLRVRVERSPR